MVKLTIYDNIFSENFTQVPVESGRSVRESYSFNGNQAKIIVNGIIKDSSYILQENDVCSIHIIPEGTAAVVGGFLLGGFAGAWWVASGNAKKFFHWVSDNVRSGLADLLGIDDIADASSPSSLAKIPTLNGSRNQSGYDKPIPLVLGTHYFTPYYCGKPYSLLDPDDGTDGENQYLYALFMIGWSPILLSDIRIGELLLTSNADKVLNGNIPITNESYFFDAFGADHPYKAIVEIQQQNEVSLYPQKVVQEDLSIPLLYREGTTPTMPIRFSASNPQKIQCEFMINGLIGYSAEGAIEDRSVQIQVQWRPRGGTNNQWHNFPAIDGATSYLNGTSTITRQKNVQMRFVTTYVFEYSEIMGISTADVEIRAVRMNIQGNDTRTSDDIAWTAIRTWCFDKEASLSAQTLIPQVPLVEKDRLKTTRLGIKIRAGEDLSGALDKINAIANSIARVWNGSSWCSLATSIANRTISNNPASVALLALQQPHIGKDPYTDQELDLDAFGKLYEFCEAKQYTANGVLITTMKEEDLLDKLLYTCRSQLIIRDGKYSPMIDNERQYPVTVLNQQNTISASNTKTFDVLPDGLRISFINKDDGYQTNEVYVMFDGKSSTDPEATFKDIDLPFVTSVAHAWKLGRYILACMKLRPETWTRKISIEGYALNIGSLASVQDDTIAIGMNAGGIITGIDIQDGEIIGITTDAHFDMLEGYTYGIKIVQALGTADKRIRTLEVVTTQGMVNHFDFVYPIPLTESVLPSVDDIVAFGEYTKITKDAIVVNKTPGNDGTYEITLVPYDDGINTADSGEIPAYDTKITKPLPIALQEVVSKQVIPLIPGKKGEQGAPGASSIVAITDPLETNATYVNNQYGAFLGFLYIWTSTGTSTGFWTIAASDPVTYENLNRYFSFDDSVGIANGKLVCIDNSGNERHGVALQTEIVDGFRGKALSIETRSSYIKI